MKKRMKHFQKEEFDLDGAGPAQPSGGPPYIRWPFRWACCIYLTFICHVFNFFVVDIFAVFCPYRQFAEGVAFIKRLFDFVLHLLAKKYRETNNNEGKPKQTARKPK